jgi:putative ABC transport system permease protein
VFKVALKGILGHKSRVVSTGLAVLLGVAFMAGTFIFTDTIQRSFDDLFADVNAGTDAYVRSSEEISGEQGPGPAFRGRIGELLIPLIATLDGVADVQGEIENFETVIIGTDGEPVGATNGPPRFGRVWSGTGPLSPWVLQGNSREPAAPDEVVIDVYTSEQSGYAIGDTVPIVTPKAGLVDYTLVGIVKFGTADGTLGATQVLFTLSEAQRVLAEPGVVDAIGVAAVDGVSQDELVSRIATLLADFDTGDIEILTGAEITAENQNDVGQALGFITSALLIFAGVAVVVGAFIIYNTFSILVAQRGRELALLRAIGATRRQVLRSVMIEAAIVGAVASVAGLIGGVVLARAIGALFKSIGFDVPSSGDVIAPRTIAVSLTVGMVVTIISAFVPASRAGRVPPIAALRDLAIDTSGSSRSRSVIAIGALALGAVGVFGGLAGGGAQLVGLGALLLLIGVGTAGPVLARPVAHVLGAPVEKLKGVTGRIARENAVRNPKRTSSTALALTIGVSLVVFISIFAASFKETTRSIFAEQFTGDIVIDSGSFGSTGISPALEPELLALPEIDTLSPLRFAPAQIADEQRIIQAVNAASAAQILDIGADPVELANLGDDGIAISQSKADDTGWTIGTPLLIDFLNGGQVDVFVETIYTETDLIANMFVDTSVFDRAGVSENFDAVLFLELSPGTSFDAGVTAVEALVAPRYPTATVQTLADFVDNQLGFINQILGLIYALLGFSCLLAGFGIANTLQLSIVERRREIGLSRAVGMTRAQVRSSFRWESVIVALFGTVLGLGLGSFFGFAAVQSLSDEGFRLAIPFGSLAIIAILAGLLGVVAALRPAWRASKLDVLGAIASE